jgi:hypothetical protein
MVEPTPKLMNILYACANGRLPWWTADDTGTWPTSIPFCEGLEYDDDDNPVDEYGGYILCCGHVLRYPEESSAVVGAGLMLPGEPDKFGRKTLTITKAGRAFLDEHRDMVQFDGA